MNLAINKSTILFLIVSILLSFLFVFAPTVNAAGPFTGQIVPCGTSTTAPCGYCDLFTLAQNIMNFLVYIAVFVAVLLFVYAGFKLITSGGNQAALTQAKGIFTSVVIGLVITLGSWLIVDTVMKTFYKGGSVDAPGGGGFGPWNKIC